MNPLRWAEHGGGKRSLLDRWPPEQAQPHPTALERAADAGVAVRTVAPGELSNTGLTRAALRGGEFRRTHATGDLVAELVTALGEPAPVLCYGYHAQLDHLGHVHRPGSLSWRMQLQQIDQFTGALVDRLPRGTLLAVVADHGMVAIDPASSIDFDSEPELQRHTRTNRRASASRTSVSSLSSAVMAGDCPKCAVAVTWWSGRRKSNTVSAATPAARTRSVPAKQGLATRSGCAAWK